MGNIESNHENMVCFADQFARPDYFNLESECAAVTPVTQSPDLRTPVTSRGAEVRGL